MNLIASWTSTEVIAVLVALGVFVTTLGTAATGVIMAWKAMNKASEANATASAADGKADGAQLSVGRLSNRANTQDAKISTLEMNSPPPPMQLVASPAPKPRRVRIGNELFEGVLTRVPEPTPEVVDDPAK